jgi:hypothetical protein
MYTIYQHHWLQYNLKFNWCYYRLLFFISLAVGQSIVNVSSAKLRILIVWLLSLVEKATSVKSQRL